MSQQAEKSEQEENTDEGKSASEKDCVDRALEVQSCTHSSSCADLTVPRSGVLSEDDMQDVKKDIVNIKEINEEHHKKISELQEKLNEVIEKQQKIISELEEKVTELSKNQHKIISELEKKGEWNLWLYGLLEQEGEDLKKRVIDICSAVAPEAADDLRQHIDTVQRVGKKDKAKNRPVIIRFTEKSTKELLWITYKTSEYHRASSLKFAEDLTAKDKEKRNRLWPIIEAARKEGKNAFFAGDKVIIDGKEISE